MTETKPKTHVEAAASDTVPVPDGSPSKTRSVVTSVWNSGKTANKESLFRQAIVNVRDAVPVASYDVSCEVKGTTAKKVDDIDGTAWEIEVTLIPRTANPEPIDLEKVIAEAQAGYGSTHPGDPNFGKDA